jgi:hypothetical protein
MVDIAESDTDFVNARGQAETRIVEGKSARCQVVDIDASGIGKGLSGEDNGGDFVLVLFRSGRVVFSRSHCGSIVINPVLVGWTVKVTIAS